MLKYHIQISCDNNFGVPQSYGFNTNPQPIAPEGISHLVVGGNSQVDPNIFQNKDFFKPVLKLLNFNKRFKDINREELINLFLDFGKITGDDSYNSWEITLDFDPDNECDLIAIYYQKDRISFQYRNSPVTSFYCIDDGNKISILLSPYTQTYWTISDTEWWYFMDYLKKEMSIQDKRDQKLRQILDDNSPNFSNIIRQLNFIVECDRRKSNSFMDSVQSYYKTHGFITQKQADALKKNIW